MKTSLLSNLLLLPLFEDPLDPGTPAPPAIPAAPAAPAAPATPVAASPAPATPGAAPDHTGMVPSYRLREAREAAERSANERWATKEREFQAKLDATQRQIQALVGVQPPQNPEADAIKQQFFQLFPWAKKLEDRFGDFESLVERAGDIDAQSQHYWQSYGRQTMDRLFNLAETSIGGPLTEEGRRQLHSSFTGFVSSSPELTDRYASDPSIVEDFWKQFTSSFIDPVRRVAATQVASRAPGALPQDTPGGTPRIANAPALQSLDDRAAAAWTQYNKDK